MSENLSDESHVDVQGDVTDPSVIQAQSEASPAVPAVDPKAIEMELREEAAKAKAEAARLEGELVKAQKKLRQKDKFIKSNLDEKKDIINQVQLFEKGEVDQISVPRTADFTEAYHAMYEGFDSGPSDDLVAVIAEIKGKETAFHFRNNWSEYPPEDLQPYINELQRRNEVSEKSELEQLRAEVAALKAATANKPAAKAKAGFIPEPLTSESGSSDTYEEKSIQDLSKLSDAEFEKYYNQL